MNFAWDAFRIVDNHSKSMIFMMPDEPRNEEYLDYIRKVEKPISLETIRVRYNCQYLKFIFYRINLTQEVIQCLKSLLKT